MDRTASLSARFEAPATASAAPVGGTQSLERAALLLREVASHGSRGARLTDLVADTGIAKATARRLLAAMVRQGMLEQETHTRRYYLGSEIFVLGAIAAARYEARTLDSNDLHRVAALSPAKYSGPRVPLAGLLCDHHADVRRPMTAALLHETAAGHTSRLTYGELRDHSSRFAAVLKGLGIQRGERIATLLPKGPEVLIAMMAAWRLGAVHMPLFGALGSQAVLDRIVHGRPSVVVTTGAFRTKLPEELPASTHIVVVEHDGAPARAGILFWSALHAAAPLHEISSYSGDDPFVLLYPAGLTGAPQGLLIPVKALASVEQSMHNAFDVRDEDVYWNIADPGWAGGLYYGVLGCLLRGRTTIFCEGPFDVGQVYRVLSKFRVTNLLAPPSWYQKMRAAENLHPPPHDLRLRVASAVGERLLEDLVDWGQRRLGVRINDNYGQAETGVVITTGRATHAQGEAPAGSMGTPLPGFRVVLLDRAGAPVAAGEQGEIAIDTEKSPLCWFSAYYGATRPAADRFRHGGRFYMTGDLARVNADGSFFYGGRKREVAAASVRYAEGHAELEALLTSQRGVAKALVMARPDKLRGELMKVFVVLEAGRTASVHLAEELLALIRPKLGAGAEPPEIEFVSRLP